MVSNWSLKKLGLIRLTHSCGNCAPSGWSFRKFGAIHSRQARFCETRRMRRCLSAFVGGEGSITSQVSGARLAGSAESKVCKKVVPVRGNPTTQRGARDRKSTRLNSSHVEISYAVFCLKKKKL